MHEQYEKLRILEQIGEQLNVMQAQDSPQNDSVVQSQSPNQVIEVQETEIKLKDSSFSPRSLHLMTPC